MKSAGIHGPVEGWVKACESPKAPLDYSIFESAGEQCRAQTSRYCTGRGQRRMSYSSSCLLPIPAPASVRFHRHHIQLKCGPGALNWSKSCLHVGSFVSAARLTKSKSRSRSIFRCSSQLAELGPATSAAYGFLLLGGGLFACKLLHFFQNFFASESEALLISNPFLFCILGPQMQNQEARDRFSEVLLGQLSWLL